MTTKLKPTLERAILDLKAGKPILLYDFDGREEETDIIYWGPQTDARAVLDLRLNAGAPLSVYIDHGTAEALGLQTFQSFVEGLPYTGYDRLKKLAEPAGGFDPRFALTLDHRSNKTGCSHHETANTISCLSALMAQERLADFEKEFRSPGHVPLIMAAPGLLEARRGHTELILTIAQLGAMQPLMVASELIDVYTGHSLSKERAVELARSRGLAFLTGAEVLETRTLTAAA